MPDTDQARTYARPGYATITVYIWGSVSAPGPWRFESDIDLIELLSVVGVPGVGTADAGFTQTNTVKIFRKEDGERRLLYEEDVAVILTSEPSYPTLQRDDILIVETRRKPRLSFQTVASYVGTLSSLLLLYLRLRRGL